jgi:septum formation protein
MLQTNPPCILASQSPRRKELLEMLGLQFEQVSSPYEEPLFDTQLKDPETFVQMLAYEKGKAVLELQSSPAIILSADTIGLLEGEVLEKPKDRSHAKEMLQALSGKTHQVLTAVCLFHPEKEVRQEVVSTEVTFRKLSEAEIDWYLDLNSYQDKAAAYAIQEEAAVFVDRIEGDYFTIVGLPIKTVWGWLLEEGILPKN